MVKLRNVDLNLLVILDVLLDEVHVGRAAARLGLSQPAASNALARARSLFNDPLLVRSAPNGLRRTPRADAMREPLRAALSELSVIVDAGPPDTADLRGAVRLLAADVPAAAIGAALIAQLATRAPGIDLVFHPWHAGDEIERLERGEVDVVVAVASFFGPSLRTEPLGTYPYTVLMRRDHPAAASHDLDIESWLAWSHVIVSGRGERRASIDKALTRVERIRRVAVVVPTFLHALELLCHSDLIGTFPAGVMTSTAAAHLTSRAAPIEIEPVSLHLVRHRRTDIDPAVRLVAELLPGISQSLMSPSARSPLSQGLSEQTMACRSHAQINQVCQ